MDHRSLLVAIDPVIGDRCRQPYEDRAAALSRQCINVARFLTQGIPRQPNGGIGHALAAMVPGQLGDAFRQSNSDLRRQFANKPARMTSWRQNMEARSPFEDAIQRFETDGYMVAPSLIAPELLAPGLWRLRSYIWA